MLRNALRILIPALVLALGASTLRADPPDGMDFGPRDGQPGESPRTPGGREEPAAPAPEDPIGRDIQALSTWPDRSGVRAAESLLLTSSEEVLPRLVAVLAGDPSPLQPGAAWVIGRIGEPAHVAAILRAAAKRTNGSRAEVFFDAALDLDAEKTKQWLFSFLTLRRPVFRTKATDFLARHIGPGDLTRVERLLNAPDPGVRVSGLRLLEPAGAEDAEVRLLNALSDLAPEVARTSSILLALRADDALLARLNQLAREGYARERAYAQIALVEVCRTRTTNAFEMDTLIEAAGRRGLLHPEKLSRAAAAVTMVYGALDATDESLRALLDGTVVDVLIDAVGGDHFRDFPSTVDLVFASLRRVSGIDLPTTATAWAAWWRAERGRFRARRPLVAMEETDLPKAYVRFELVEANGRRSRAQFRPEDGPIGPDDLLLEVEAFEALTGALEEAGIFEAETLTRPRADEHLVVVLGVMNQERRMVVPADHEDYPLLRMRMDSLVDANLWQRYRDPDQWPDMRAWWKKNAEMMAQASPEARRQMLKASIVHTFDNLVDDAARNEALDTLEALEEDALAEGGQMIGLTATETQALVQAAVGGPGFGELEQRAVRFALRQAAVDRVRTELIEALATRNEPDARELLAELIAAGGPQLVRDAFADARASMRGAAARAAQALLDAADAQDPERRAMLAEAFRPGLEVLSHDDDDRVAIRALVGLERLGDEQAFDRLEDIFTTRNMGVRIAVAEALGEMNAEAVYPFLSLILAEEREVGSGALRGAALQSLARTGHPNAVSLLSFYLVNDLDPNVQTAAGDALVGLGTEDARFAIVRALTEGRQPDALRRARLVDVLGRFDGRVVEEMLASYLEDPDEVVSQTAALRLADHNSAVAVPYLIEMARKGSPAQAEAAITGLENITSIRFDITGNELIAEQYERWYATASVVASGLPDRAWFMDALRKRGYEAGLLASYVAGESDPMGVPVLLRALRDEDSVIRRNAALALRRITGLEFGEVDRSTSVRDAARVADRWVRWWDRVSGATDGNR
ncbi:MAG: HEAT repeat domain-containing protein [Planctomycetota bacterium]|jgi:HEAT repeat protein